MREMKDSGEVWIGKVPKNWTIQVFKTHIESHFGGCWGEDAKNDDNDRLCIRIADFDFAKQGIKNSASTIRNYTLNQIEKCRLQDGDLIVEKSGGGDKTPVGRVVIFDGNQFRKDTLFANFSECVRLKKDVLSKYVAYQLKALYYVFDMHYFFKQTTGLQNLDINTYINTHLCFPALPEQKKIAEKLDLECSKVDALIANEEKQIEKLKEYKQSLITEVVTKGLDPDAPMKDSGVELIGLIPCNWECVSISRIASVVRGASPRPAGDPRFFYGDYIPWITVAEVTKGGDIYINNTDSYLTKEGAEHSRIVEEGTLLLSNSGATLGVPKITNIRGCINDGSVAFIDITIDKKYLLYVLSAYTLELRKQRQGYGQPNLNTDIVKSIRIPVPSKKEQSLIVDYLDNKNKNIEQLITIKQKKIDNLNQFKKSLIYEYVTGKKEVN